MAEDGPGDAPQTAQDAFKMPPGLPKMPPRAAKVAQDGPRAAHGGPQTAQDGPKTARAGPKTAQDASQGPAQELPVDPNHAKAIGKSMFFLMELNFWWSTVCACRSQNLKKIKLLGVRRGLC